MRIKFTMVEFYMGSKCKVICLLFCLLCFSTNASSQFDESSAVEFSVNTVFDSTRSDSTIYQKYFGFNASLGMTKGTALANRVSEQLQLALNSKFEEFALPSTGQFASKDVIPSDVPSNTLYSISDTLFVDGDASLNMKVAILHLPTNRRVVNFETLLKQNVKIRKDWWRELSDPISKVSKIEQILDKIAISLVARIDKDIVNRILESSFRIRVAVKRFKKLGAANRYDNLDLEQALKIMVESELSRSETIMIFAQNEDVSDQSFYNYLIEGSFFEMENQLRIDIKCIKEKSSRILTGRSVTLDTIDVKTLSRKIADISNQLKRTMEADFKKSTKSAAIVATPPVRLFKKATKEDVTISLEIARALMQKLKLLTSGTDEGELYLNLQVLDNRRKMAEYIEHPLEPAEIISDLNVDFLVVVSYENLGNFVRISTNLHSFDVERPAFAQLIAEQKVKKSVINDAINSTAESLLNTFIDLGYLVKKASDGALIKVDKATFKAHMTHKDRDHFKNMHEVTVPEVRRLKGVGLRAGAVARRASKDIFVGNNTGIYYEVYFSYLVPIARRLGIDLGFEPSIGVDTGKGNILLRGVGGMNGFVNIKLVYSGLKDADLPIISNLPFTVSLGTGIGWQSVWYNLKEGDKNYSGTDFKDANIEFAYTYFTEVEFPLFDRLLFTVLFRGVSESKEITSFEDVDYNYDQPIRGPLGGYYIVGGLRYAWR